MQHTSEEQSNEIEEHGYFPTVPVGFVKFGILSVVVILVVILLVRGFSSDWDIVPGERAGPYEFGKPLNLSTEALDQLKKDGLVLHTTDTEEKRLTYAVAVTAKYHTIPGRIRIGDTEEDIRKVFGPPSDISDAGNHAIGYGKALTYDGIRFVLIERRIRGIVVWGNHFDEVDE